MKLFTVLLLLLICGCGKKYHLVGEDITKTSLIKNKQAIIVQSALIRAHKGKWPVYNAKVGNFRNAMISISGKTHYNKDYTLLNGHKNYTNAIYSIFSNLVEPFEVLFTNSNIIDHPVYLIDSGIYVVKMGIFEPCLSVTVCPYGVCVQSEAKCYTFENKTHKILLVTANPGDVLYIGQFSIHSFWNPHFGVDDYFDKASVYIQKHYPNIAPYLEKRIMQSAPKPDECKLWNQNSSEQDLETCRLKLLELYGDGKSQ